MKLPEGKKCDLATLTELYGNKEVAEAILLSAGKHETIERIESGELNLPEKHDAHEYLKRQKLKERFPGRDDITEAILSNPKLEPLIAPVHEPHKPHAHKDHK